jgi:hypothetical protein
VGPIDLLRADVTEPKDSESYQVILDRNPFALRAPMAPPPELTNPPPVKVDVKITGVTAHSGVKKAWLMIPAVAGKSPNPRYLSMMEGDKDGDLQVLEINEKDATVKVLNAGVPVVLNFRENGLAAPTALAVAGATAARGRGDLFTNTGEHRRSWCEPAVSRDPAQHGDSHNSFAQSSDDAGSHGTGRRLDGSGSTTGGRSGSAVYSAKGSRARRSASGNSDASASKSGLSRVNLPASPAFCRSHFTSIIPALRLALSSSVWMSLNASKIPGSLDFSIFACAPASDGVLRTVT